MRYLLILIFSLLTLQSHYAVGQSNKSDSKILERALDYFAGEKYHEALLLLRKLDEKYNLNPRFKAYLGVCYFHEFDYEKACSYLDETINQLDVYSPAERSVYYNVAAESHFMLNEYEKAIPLYEKKLLVCRNEEKGDIYYRLGFCYMFNSKWECASEYFKSAMSYYTTFNAGQKTTRMAQLDKMIKGCEENAGKL